jgi:hypothetical protein
MHKQADEYHEIIKCRSVWCTSIGEQNLACLALASVGMGQSSPWGHCLYKRASQRGSEDAESCCQLDASNCAQICPSHSPSCRAACQKLSLGYHGHCGVQIAPAHISGSQEVTDLQLLDQKGGRSLGHTDLYVLLKKAARSSMPECARMHLLLRAP